MQERCQATLVRLMSITEAFAAEMLSREVEHSLTRTSNPSAVKIAEDAIVRGTGTWQAQQSSYKDWFNVKVDWKPIERLAEARNAVAHGLGKLTRHQMKKAQSITNKLKEAGIAVKDHGIVLSDENLVVAAITCRDFIERLDRAVQEKKLG